MAINCSIIFQDENGNEEYLYRNCDGNPIWVLADLYKIAGWIQDNKISHTVQCAGDWLILIGHKKYINRINLLCADLKVKHFEPITSIVGHKIGDYEHRNPTYKEDYIYTFNVETLEIKVKVLTISDDDIVVYKNAKTITKFMGEYAIEQSKKAKNKTKRKSAIDSENRFALIDIIDDGEG